MSVLTNDTALTIFYGIHVPMLLFCEISSCDIRHRSTFQQDPEPDSQKQTNIRQTGTGYPVHPQIIYGCKMLQISTVDEFDE